MNVTNTLSAAALLCSYAAAQCPVPAQSPDFAVGPGPEGPISQVIAFDPDGSGPLEDDLFVIGEFSRVAGSAGYSGFARFNGTSWSAVPGLIGPQLRFIVSGETIFVTSSADIISGERNLGFAARYLPSSNDWEALDVNGPLTTVQVYAEGHLLGGSFTQAGGQNIRDYALLQNGQWSQPPRIAGSQSLLAVALDRFVAFNFTGVWTQSTLWYYDGTWRPLPAPPGNGGDLHAYQNELYYVVVQMFQNVVQVATYRYDGTRWVSAPRLPGNTGTQAQYQFRSRDDGRIQIRRAEDVYNAPPLCVLTFADYQGDGVTFIDYRGVLLVLGGSGAFNGVTVGNLSLIDPAESCIPTPLTPGLNLRPTATFVTGADASAPITLYDESFVHWDVSVTENIIIWEGARWGNIFSRTPVDAYAESAVSAYVGDTLYVTHRYAGPNPLTRFDAGQPVNAFELPAGYFAVQLITQGTQSYLVAASDSANPRTWRLQTMGTNGGPDDWQPAFAPLPDPSARLATLTTEYGDVAFAYHVTSNATIISRWNGTSWELAQSLSRLSNVRAVVHEGKLVIAGESGTQRTPALFQIDHSGNVAELQSIPDAPPQTYIGFLLISNADTLFLVASTRSGFTVTDTVWALRGAGWTPITTLPSRLGGRAPVARAYESGLLLYSGTNLLPDGDPTFRFTFIPAPTLCVADQNCDGGVDGADIEAFFITFAAGSPAADVNNDGGVDGSDVEAFYSVWTSGDPGCR